MRQRGLPQASLANPLRIASSWAPRLSGELSSLPPPSTATPMLNRSAVVAIGVESATESVATTASPAQCQEREVFANFPLTGFSDVLKAKLYYIGVSCSGVSTL